MRNNLEREWEPVCRNEEEDEQFKRPSNSACRMSDPVDRKLTRKQEAWIRLACLHNRLAGFETDLWLHKFGLPDFEEPEIRFCSSKLLCEFGFPVLLTGRPVVKQRRSLANPVFRIENPVIRISTRELQNEKTAFRLIRSGIPVKRWKIFLKFCKLLDLYYTHNFIFDLKNWLILNHLEI